ncbi:MAG TPA: hypothetical protein VKK19_18910 [Candidatus Dormibacteraeota bacterium]|nr:hypothetical protein [Candidatus Dormibacteraeota bacterium]
MATLYDIISELRRETQTPSASKTLDMVVAELGRTRDNLKEALRRLESRPVPAGGKAVLDQLDARATAEGVDDYEVPLSPDELRASYEPIDGSQVGIALLLGATGLLIVVLGVAAFVAGLNGILR